MAVITMGSGRGKPLWPVARAQARNKLLPARARKFRHRPAENLVNEIGGAPEQVSSRLGSLSWWAHLRLSASQARQVSAKAAFASSRPAQKPCDGHGLPWQGR